jgi:hypothetical protein
MAAHRVILSTRNLRMFPRMRKSKFDFKGIAATLFRTVTKSQAPVTASQNSAPFSTVLFDTFSDDRTCNSPDAKCSHRCISRN